jgi:hypothetical protein
MDCTYTMTRFVFSLTFTGTDWVMYSTVDHTANFATVTFDNYPPLPIGDFPARWERALHQWANPTESACGDF